VRKYFIGFIIGIFVASALPAYAGVTSLIGKKVASEIEVSYNNKQVGSAIVVEGRSYLPVRSMSDALGLTLDVSKEAVQLTSSTKATIPIDPYDSIANKQNELDVVKSKRNIAIRERDQKSGGIENLKVEIERAKQRLDGLSIEDQRYRKISDGITYYEQQIDNNRSRIAELDTQIAEYDNQIAALETELAELEGK